MTTDLKALMELINNQMYYSKLALNHFGFDKHSKIGCIIKKYRSELKKYHFDIMEEIKESDLKITLDKTYFLDKKHLIIVENEEERKKVFFNNNILIKS